MQEPLGDCQVGPTTPLTFKKPVKRGINLDPNTRSPHQPMFLSPQSRQTPFDNVKKIQYDTAGLRQTMDPSRSVRCRRENDFNEEEASSRDWQIKVNPRTPGVQRVKSQRMIPDMSEWLDRSEQKQETSMRTMAHEEAFRLHESRAGQSSPRTEKQAMRHNMKIDKNKRMIEELTKIANGRDYLKNVPRKEPVYLQLDQEKQISPKRTEASSNPFVPAEDFTACFSPKHTASTLEKSKNDSPLLQPKRLTQKDIKDLRSTMGSATSRRRGLSALKPTSLIDEFEVGRKLGEGKFGSVHFARHGRTGGVFALKKIPKSLIKSHMMVDQLSLELRIQSCVHHRNIVEMYGFFEDLTNFYILLEYMQDGTLYHQLKVQKPGEKQTAVIIRQMAQTLDYLHDIGVAHRDIKPQNIVVSGEVYKLCDFGWAAICTDRRKTYCGTFDYAAPQILQGAEYDMTVDLWCLGVLTYQLLTGRAPFYHISRKQTMKKILNVDADTLEYPEDISNTARDFMQKLIRKNPMERMSAGEALLHPFLIVQEE